MQLTVEISEATEQSLRDIAAMLDMSLEAFVKMRLRQEAERGYQRLLDARDRADDFKKRWAELHKDIGGPVLSLEAMSRKNLVPDVE